MTAQGLPDQVPRKHDSIRYSRANPIEWHPALVVGVVDSRGEVRQQRGTVRPHQESVVNETGYQDAYLAFITQRIAHLEQIYPTPGRRIGAWIVESKHQVPGKNSKPVLLAFMDVPLVFVTGDIRFGDRIVRLRKWALPRIENVFPVGPERLDEYAPRIPIDPQTPHANVVNVP